MLQIFGIHIVNLGSKGPDDEVITVITGFRYTKMFCFRFWLFLALVRVKSTYFTVSYVASRIGHHNTYWISLLPIKVFGRVLKVE